MPFYPWLPPTQPTPLTEEEWKELSYQLEKQWLEGYNKSQTLTPACGRSPHGE